MSAEFECSLRDDVVADLAKGLSFGTAFANAVHKHRIFHTDPATRATYNYLYRAVEKRTKCVLGTDQKLWSEKARERVASVTARQKTVTPPPEKLPVRRRAFTGKMAAAGERPEDYDD